MKFSNKLLTLLLCSTLGICFLINTLFFILFNSNYNFFRVIILLLSNFSIILTSVFIYKYIDKNFIRRLVPLENSINKLKNTSKMFKGIDVIFNKVIEADSIGEMYDDVNNIIDKLIYMENTHEEEEQMYINIINAMSNSFFQLKAIENEEGNCIDGIIIDANLAALELLDVTREEIINKRFSDIYINFERDKNLIYPIFNRIEKSKSECISKEINITKDKWGMVSIYAIKKGYFSIIVNNVTEIKKYAESMSYIANYDTLTNLLNRHNLLEYLIDLVRNKEEFSVFFIDLDNFKNINDTLGHDTGDKVLKIISNKLKNLYSDVINVGRLGGDEFIIVRKGKNDIYKIKELAIDILGILNENFRINKYNFNIEASIGISFYPQHADDVFTLLKYADIAMYEGKENGGNEFKIFSENMLQDIDLENKLRVAIDNNELVSYYQPIYDVKTNKIVAAESLIRWITKEEVIQPNKFIPIAKKNGEILRIDEFVLKEAVRYCKEIMDLSKEDFTVSVNISHLLLKQFDFIERITNIVKEAGISPRNIKLEITEDETIEDTEFTVNILNKLRNIGFGIALDDFGVGYSSFNHIKTLPLDTLKIDRSLLINLEEDNKTLSIVETLIDLAHTLELEVTCEGIEIGDQIRLLKNIGCDKIQGYYISKPLSKNDFKEFLINFNKTTEDKIIN